jgi:hypothetical protein
VVTGAEALQPIHEEATSGGNTVTVEADGSAAGAAPADGSALIDLLAVRDVDDPTDSVIFQLTSLPQHGTLYLGENPLVLGATFSQFDIDNGVLSYQSGAWELEPGTYSAGDTTGLPDDHCDIAWSGLNVYAVDPPSDAGSLDLAAADMSRVDFSAHGLGLAATGDGDALVLDFRAEVSGVRVDLHEGQDSNMSVVGRGSWEAYDANGGLVDSGILGDGQGAQSRPLAIAAEDGASFRYLLLRADEPAAAAASMPVDNLYVRTVEYDVVPAPVADAFSFRAEDGHALATIDGDPAALGYTIVDGEAVFSIAIAPDLS